MKKWMLPLAGLLPLVLGVLLDRAMMTVFFDVTPPLRLIGILTLGVWFGLAFLLGGWAGDPRQAAALLNLPALLVLVLLGVQELALHAYWQNLAGVLTQLFFFPLLSLGFALTGWSQSVFSAYCAAFLLLAAASYLGARFRFQRRR